MSVDPSYLARLEAIHRLLGIPASFTTETRMPLHGEATELCSIGLDIHGREQRLTPDTAQRWQAMQAAAAKDGISLQVVSGFRSLEYQQGIWTRKLARGLKVEEIIKVNAPPGYSEHHAGTAVDITTPGFEPVEEVFEKSPAFAWLTTEASRFGFGMPYTRENPFGIIYEPWHWSIPAAKT